MNKSPVYKIKYYHLVFLFFLAHCYPTPKVQGQFTDAEFEQMASQMAKGAVKDLSVEELNQLKESVVLMDARQRKEFEVSHIPNAIWVGYDEFEENKVAHIDKSATIVTYCSVGYRSERVGEKLQQAGFKNVYNLKGSLFQWVNEGYPIVNGQNQSTQQVHGYNKEWGKWLKKGEVVY